MEVHDDRYKAVENAYAEAARSVRWAYTHWALDGGIHAALNHEMGAGVAASITDLLNAVEMLLTNKDQVDKSFLPLRAEDNDPDNDFP
jgi:hypothetical protein